MPAISGVLLASYRVAFEMLVHRNQLAEAAVRLERAAQQSGDHSLLLSMPIPHRSLRQP